MTLAVNQVALEGVTSSPVTLACLTSIFGGHVIVIGSALVTLFAHHIRETGTLAAERVADCIVCAVRSQRVADALCTLLLRGITKVPSATNLAIGTRSVVQTPQTITCSGVTVSRLRQVSVAVALALGARAAHRRGTTPVVVVTPVTPIATVSGEAATDGVLGSWIQVTGVCVRDTAPRNAGARTRSTRDIDSDQRVAIEAVLTRFTRCSTCVVLAVDANPSL